MTTPEDEDEFGELVDPDISRMDSVGKAANGTPWLIAKSAADSPALFDPELVRKMVAKADGRETPTVPDAVTVAGSPEAIARMMHAAVRADLRQVAKADMSTADINDLPDSAFAYIEPGGEKDDGGKTTPRSKRHFPVHDEAHVRNALSRAPQSPFGPRAMPKIRAAAEHFGVTVAKADGDGDGEPGSPAWESEDADTAEGVLADVLAIRPRIQALAAREGAEVGAGHMEDLRDVFDLQGAQDSLMQAAKLLGGFAVSERAEAGVAKAQAAPNTPPAAAAAPSPQESTVPDTQAVEATAAAPASAPAQTVAKSDAAGALSEAEYAELGREFLRKMAAEKATETTGATAPGEDARVIPGTETVQAPAQAPGDVMKATATLVATAVGEAMAPLAKQLGELAGRVESQTGRVEKALSQPDDRRSPLLNGATGTAGLAPSHRGTGFQDRPEFEPIRKALDALPDGPQKEEAARGVAIAAIKGRFGN